MNTSVYSTDGTTISLTTTGSGPHLILIDGALCYRTSGPNEALAKILKEAFTVTTYDRRGRGESSDTLPYSIQKEIEDLNAVIDQIGEPVMVYGISSVAALALQAANTNLMIKKLALYEAPFIVDDTRKPLPDNYLENLKSYSDNDQKSKTVSYFMSEGIGLPGFVIFLMKLMPAWSRMKEIAHTIIYDTMILGDSASGKPLSPNAWSNVSATVLVICGGKSPQWITNAMKQLAGVLKNASYKELEGQTHIVKPEVLAPVLTEFFNS